MTEPGKQSNPTNDPLSNQDISNEMSNGPDPDESSSEAVRSAAESDTDETLIDRMRSIADTAAEQGVELRAVGSTAFRIHCDEAIHADAFEREIGDIDFVGYKRDKEQIHDLLERQFDYEIDKELLMASWDQRMVFYGEYEGIEHEIDLFLNEISMCHVLRLVDRLEIGVNEYVLNPSDLFLEKAQIVEINEKDLMDLIALLLEFPVDNSESEINKRYIAELLANDWGFYYTVTTTLSRIDYYVSETPLNDADRELVHERLQELEAEIEAEPKSLQWKLREKIGPRIKWYNDVGEKHR